MLFCVRFHWVVLQQPINQLLINQERGPLAGPGEPKPGGSGGASTQLPGQSIPGPATTGRGAGEKQSDRSHALAEEARAMAASQQRRIRMSCLMQEVSGLFNLDGTPADCQPKPRVSQ